MSDQAIVDFAVRGLERLFSPPGILLVDKGAEQPTTCVALIGDAGGGKTTAALAVAHAIARDQSGVVLYLTTELFSTELSHKLHFLGLDDAQVLRTQNAANSRRGDVISQHLALLRENIESGAVEQRALEVAVELTQTPLPGCLPVRSIVIDAFPLSSRRGPASPRDAVVTMIQALEGRGMSVIIVDEDGTLGDYVPFVADIVLELRFERDADAGELHRRISCRKSRYTRSLPGPHDTGMNFGRPAVWPDPLRVLVEQRAAPYSPGNPMEFILPTSGANQFARFRGGSILLSIYDEQTPIARLLRNTPGARLATVRCGPLTQIAADGVPGVTTGEWEGPYSMAWAIFDLCRRAECNGVIFQDVEGILADSQTRRRFAHVLEALRKSGLLVCVHGTRAGLAPIKPQADYVWRGKYREHARPDRPLYRSAADWLAIEAWTVMPRAEGEDVGTARSVHDRLKRFAAHAHRDEPDAARAELDGFELALGDIAGRILQSQVAVGYHLLGATRAAEARLAPSSSDDMLLGVSKAWALTLLRDGWTAMTEILKVFQQSDGHEVQAGLLWATVIAMYTGNDAAMTHVLREVEKNGALLPFALRGLGARRRWSEIDMLVSHAAQKYMLPEFLMKRIAVDLRLENDDEQPEEQILALATDDRVPNLHRADEWHNLGVLRSRQGRIREAVKCWRSALGMNPMLEISARCIAERADGSVAS
jgi:KaiC/GvpD/RAD55 family RecA-like ATPase